MGFSTYVLTDGKDTVIEYPYSESQLLLAHPNVSFPVPVPEQLLAAYNVFPVEDVDSPTEDTSTATVVLSHPIKQGEGWIQNWTVTKLAKKDQADKLTAWRSEMTCHPLNGKIELHNRGLLDAADKIIVKSEKKIQLAWWHSTVWKRTSDLIQTLEKKMDLSASDWDNLFKVAQQMDV